MGRPSMTPQKRPQPESSTRRPPLNDIEHKIYQLIKSKESMGIFQGDIKRETGIQDPTCGKVVRSLQTKNYIKFVTSVHHKGKRILMGVEFEPGKEISGGSWYSEGSLDIEFIKILRDQCLKHVEMLKVATIDVIHKSIQNSRVFTTEITMQQITEIVRAMVLDKEIEELKSSEKGDFRDIKAGKLCYRSLRGREGPKGGTFSSIPCGVCPMISECTPDGIISPHNCVYYSKWLGLEF